MTRYVSKAVEVEAWHLPLPDIDTLGWGDDPNIIFKGRLIDGRAMVFEAIIATPEGVMTASEGDWIIRGTEGELYPCKDSVFRRKYEPVKADA
ncbi:MAG: hypothetical protein KGL35_08080 [Bradyrhizobium sp.]|nr:hypothetical protein [Bradyrhizobium sp.]